MVNSRMTEGMAKEDLNGQMEGYMMVAGKQGSNMEKAYSSHKMELRRKANGKTEKGLNGYLNNISDVQ